MDGKLFCLDRWRVNVYSYNRNAVVVIVSAIADKKNCRWQVFWMIEYNGGMWNGTESGNY